MAREFGFEAWLLGASLLTCACSSSQEVANPGLVVGGDAQGDSGALTGQDATAPDVALVAQDVAQPTPDVVAAGKIAIYLKGVQDKPAAVDGLAAQTPTGFQIALSRYSVLKAIDDPAPQVCFDLKDQPAVADMAGDNLMGSCATSGLTTAMYSYGRTKVDWSKFTVKGTLHYGGQPYAGKFTFFRAWSDTVVAGKAYKAGTGTLRFQDNYGLVDNTVNYAYPPVISPPGVTMATVAGEFSITFPYTKPLPIVQGAPGDYWARFNWHVLDGFRWQDEDKATFAKDVWDVVMPPDVSVEVKVFGATGYDVTTSLD